MKTLMLVSLILIGCAHQPRLNQAIQKGDSVRRVYRLYGQPNFDVPSAKTEGARAFYYVDGDTVCGVAIKDEVVVRIPTCMPWNPEFHAFINSMGYSEYLPQYRK